jgi:hypothetical protein
LPSLGGAIAAFVSIDEYARYVIGTLENRMDMA